MAKGKKMDPKVVAIKTQDYEVNYISNKFKVAPQLIREIASDVGKGRKKIEAELRALGHQARTKKKGENWSKPYQPS